MGKYKKAVWAALTAMAVLAVLILIGNIYPMMYCINDDVMIRNILSGSYTGTPEGRAVYVKYPLSLLLSLLYCATRRIPWFSLFMAGSFWLGCSMVLAHIAGNAPAGKRWKFIALTGVSLLFFVLFLPNFICLHYTVAAAVLAGCGIFLAATDADLPSLFLLILSYCLRSQVFFLSVPFLGVVILWKLGRKGIKKQIIFPVILAVCIILCAVWNGWMYRSEEWGQYLEYNDARTELYDYHDLLPYGEYAGEYEGAGIDEAHHKLMEEYLITLDRSIDPEMMRKAAAIHADWEKVQKGFMGRLTDSVRDYYYHMRYTDKPYNYILIGMYLLAAAVLLGRKQFRRLFLIFCMGFGRSLIWIYLLWRGRFPERLILSLYILELMALAGMLCHAFCFDREEGGWISGVKWVGYKKVIAGSLLIVSGALTLYAGIIQVRSKGAEAVEQQSRQLEWEALTDYCEENAENIYLLDVRTMVSYGGSVWENLSESQNYFLQGGWTAGTPYLNDRFASFGAEDGGEFWVGSSAGQEGRVFFIVAFEKNMEWLEAYLSGRFGEIHLVPEDSILCAGRKVFCVYGLE